MYYIYNPADSDTEGMGGAMKTQEQKTAEAQITEELVSLISGESGEDVRWNGSTSDLLEIVRIAYMQSTVCNEDGRSCTFRELVTAACAVTHVRMPHNIYAVAARAANRKGLRNASFLKRYMRCPALFRKYVVR